jgi:cytoskeletal protein RodZ
MDSVFQDLKRAREAKHLSISDVSDVTLINSRFLEAIEEGRTDILPQTYVRAFIREYANCVGLDPADIMKRYDASGTPPPAASPEPGPEQPSPPPPRIEPIKAEPSPASVLKPVSSSRFVLPVLLLIIVSVVIWNLKRPSPQESIRENPVELAATVAPKETTAVPATATQPVKLTDSLTLAATVSESVWVQIVIDDRSPQQYLFRPSRKITWRARDRFRLSTGNAGALDLTLNDRRLGVPGKRGAILRGVEYNRQTLQQK